MARICSTHLPGMDWELEISRAIRDADAIIVCLSTKSVTKEGFVQKEIKNALDISDEKPEGTIYLIPLLLDDCEVPQRIKKWQWVDFYEKGAQRRLNKALRLRFDGILAKEGTAKAIALKTEGKKPAVEKTRSTPKTEAKKTVIQETKPRTVEVLDLYQFIQIPKTPKVIIGSR